MYRPQVGLDHQKAGGKYSGTPQSATPALSSDRVRYLTRPNTQGPGATGTGMPLSGLGTVTGGAKQACQWSLIGRSGQVRYISVALAGGNLTIN